MQKRHINQLLAAAVLSFGLAGADLAIAGDHGKGPHMGPPSPEQMLAHMKENLQLTDAQVPQVKQILEQEMAKHEAARKEGRAALEKVLNKDQLQKLDQMRENHGKRGGKHGHDDEDGEDEDHGEPGKDGKKGGPKS